MGERRHLFPLRGDLRLQSPEREIEDVADLLQRDVSLDLADGRLRKLSRAGREQEAPLSRHSEPVGRVGRSHEVEAQAAIAPGLFPWIVVDLDLDVQEDRHSVRVRIRRNRHPAPSASGKEVLADLAICERSAVRLGVNETARSDGTEEHLLRDAVHHDDADDAALAGDLLGEHRRGGGRERGDVRIDGRVDPDLEDRFAVDDRGLVGDHRLHRGSHGTVGGVARTRGCEQSEDDEDGELLHFLLPLSCRISDAFGAIGY